MKAATLFLTGALAILPCMSKLTAEDRYLLDLTRPSELPQSAKSGFGCGPRLGGGDHGGFVQPIAPLTFEIVSFDKSAYTLGEDMICQIRLTNVGSKPVRIPWNPNSDYGNKDCTGGAIDTAKASLTATVALVFTSADGSERGLPLYGLYGRPSIPDTIRTLNPGETASIKVMVRLVLPVAPRNQPSVRSLDLPQDFAITATYNLDDTSLVNPYTTVTSKNHVMLTVERGAGAIK
jgi:hypothetical protein